MAKKAAKKAGYKTGIVASIKAEQNCNGCWFWSITAHNGETLAHSEAYSSEDACLVTAKQLATQLKVPIAIFE